MNDVIEGAEHDAERFRAEDAQEFGDPALEQNSGLFKHATSCRGQLENTAPGVVRVEAADNQPTFLESVELAADGVRRDTHRLGDLGGAEVALADIFEQEHLGYLEVVGRAQTRRDALDENLTQRPKAVHEMGRGRVGKYLHVTNTTPCKLSPCQLRCTRRQAVILALMSPSVCEKALSEKNARGLGYETMAASEDDDTNASPLPAGLSVRKKHQSLETVVSNPVVLRLLASGHGTEIADIALKQGEHITLVPADDNSGHATEMYFVLEGEARCTLPHGSLELHARDYLVTQDLEEPVTLVAHSNVTLLYVTSQPFFHEISQSMQELMRLAVEIEQKDGYTADHCRRLQRLSYATGSELGLSSHRLNLLDYGAYLHDVGKVRVPLSILQKLSALSPEEWRVIEQHPSFGRELLEPTFMDASGPIVEQHHERLDGSGYPFGLAGEGILLESYIVAVADTYDAMTTDRAYRRALSPEVAFTELHKHAGLHYPLDVVRAFSSAVNRLEVPPS